MNSPKTDSGAAYAGDIKYRDLNGDGVITEQDQRKIGDSNLAEWSYGFFVGAAYKGLDVKALLQELQIGIIHMLILILWPLKMKRAMEMNGVEVVCKKISLGQSL